MDLLCQMGWTQTFLGLALFLVCCLLMIVILLQKGRGGGLSGAFGGGGGSSAFGAKTGDLFTWITVVVAMIFLFGNVVANYAFDESAKNDNASEPVQAAPVTPEPSAEGDALPISVTPIDLSTVTAPAGDAAGTGADEASSGATPDETPPSDVTPDSTTATQPPPGEDETAPKDEPSGGGETGEGGTGGDSGAGEDRPSP